MAVSTGSQHVMQKAGISNFDKNIVERRARNNAMRSAMTAQKARLADESSDAPACFDGELLDRHAKMQWQLRLMILLGLFASLAGCLALFGFSVTFWWAPMALLATGIQLALARRFSDTPPDERDNKRWDTIFNTVQLMLGLVWSAPFVAHLLQPGIAELNSQAFAAIIVLMGLALLTSYNLRLGVLLWSLPPAMAMAACLLLEGTMGHATMAFILIGACAFFHYIGKTMRKSWINHLKSEQVRDQLIVELEAATSISDEARRRAEEANLAKSRFLATMSHELRTPLNAILGFSEIMSHEVMGPLPNDHYREYVADIHSSGSHLLNLINEILDLSRIEAGRYEMNEEPVSLTAVAEESRQMVKLKASNKNINIVPQIQPDLPYLKADERAVRQIILNLLSNALKFTPEGGSIWMRVGWTAGGGQYVAIRDTGPGIAEDEIPVVLSSFGQGSIAIKSAEQGTGLGLPIVQALVHMHDGHFELKSKLRAGTEAIASFPRARVLAQTGHGPSGDLHRPAHSGFADPRRQVQPPAMTSDDATRDLLDDRPVA